MGDRYIGEQLDLDDMPDGITTSADIDAKIQAHVALPDPHTQYASLAGGDTYTGGYTIQLPADQSFIIDGSTNPRTATLGALRLVHTPAVDNTRPLSMVINANGFNTRGMEINCITGASSPTTDSDIIAVSIDASSSTGGIIHAYHTDITIPGSVEVYAVHAHTGVNPISTWGPGTAFPTVMKYNGSYTDISAQISSSSSNVSIFDTNGDMLYVGHSTTYNGIAVNLAGFANGGGVKQTHQFWNGTTWTTFSPSDGTNRFRQSGSIAFTSTLLTGWSETTVNNVTRYWVRMTRTQANIISPVESTFTVSTGIAYGWDKNGIITISELHSLAGAGTPPFTVASSTKVGNLAADNNVMYPRTAVSSYPYTILSSDVYMACSNTGTLSLSPAQTNGRYLTIKNVGVGAVTLGGTIDGIVNPVLTSFQWKTIRYFGTSWEVIG